MEKVYRERNCGLDILRIIATAIIVFHHYQQAFGVTFDSGVNYYGGEIFSGGLMVQFFFMLSGYLIVKYIPRIIDGLSFGEYFKRRALRLLPLVSIAALVFEVVVWYGSIHESNYLKIWGLRVSLWGWLIDSLGIQALGIFDNPCVNNPTWFVSVLLACYVVFYFLTWIAGKLNVDPLWGYVGMIFLGLSILRMGWTYPFLACYGFDMGYYSFGGGLVLGIIHDRLLKRTEKNIKATIEIAECAILVCFLWMAFFHTSWIKENSTLLITFILYPALIILVQNNIVRKCVDFTFVEVLGKITFDVYIWHGVMLTALMVIGEQHTLPLDVNKRVIMYLFTLLAFVVGTISHFFLEKPINKCLMRMNNL